MSFKDILKDSLVSALRNPGDVGGTLGDFRSRQGHRKADDSRVRLEAAMGAAARNAYELVRAKEQQGPWEVQFQNEDFRIDVRSGFSRDRQCVTTEVEVYLLRNNSNHEHRHVVYDDSGNEIFSEWRKDRK